MAEIPEIVVGASASGWILPVALLYTGPDRSTLPGNPEEPLISRHDTIKEAADAAVKIFEAQDFKWFPDPMQGWLIVSTNIFPSAEMTIGFADTPPRSAP